MKPSSTFLLLLGVSSVLLPGCSSTGSSNETAVAQVEVENPDEVTCRSIVKTGTRIGTRVCKTNRAWAAKDPSARTIAEDAKRSTGHITGIMQGN